MRFRKLVQQALYLQPDMPRMQHLKIPKKSVRFEPNNNGISSMPGVNQIVKKNEGAPSQNGRPRRPYVIGVVGGTNSGKTSVCKKIITEVKFIL